VNDQNHDRLYSDALTRAVMGDATERDQELLSILEDADPASAWPLYLAVLDRDVPWPARLRCEFDVVEPAARRLGRDGEYLLVESLAGSVNLREFLIDSLELELIPRSYFAARVLTDLLCRRLGVDPELRLIERWRYAEAFDPAQDDLGSYVSAVASLALHHAAFADLHVRQAARNLGDPTQVVRAVAWASSIADADATTGPEISGEHLDHAIWKLTVLSPLRQDEELASLEWVGATAATEMFAEPGSEERLSRLVQVMMPETSDALWSVVRRILRGEA
jgi:hypothetical protein